MTPDDQGHQGNGARMFGRGTARTGRRVTGVAVAGMLAMTAACGDGGGPEPERPAGSAPAPTRPRPPRRAWRTRRSPTDGASAPTPCARPTSPVQRELHRRPRLLPAAGQPRAGRHRPRPRRRGPPAGRHPRGGRRHRRPRPVAHLRGRRRGGRPARPRRRGESCAGGFTEVRTLARAKVLSVEPAEAPALGDEAKAFRITIEDVKSDRRLYEYLTVVRSGPTTLSFRADYLGTKDVGGVPREIVEAQWKQFTDAGSGST
ncbi:hypothetical protein ACFQ60_34035 [Streptomyces zhihengii]